MLKFIAMKEILGVIALIAGFAGYFPYVRDMLKGKTRPHAFSWLAWGSLETVAFFAQLAEGGGAGAWITAASAVISFSITIYAFSRADKQIEPLDWVALSGAFVGIALWRLTDNPLLAVISVTVSDALGFVPTFRKSFNKPHEETLAEYAFSSVKWVISVPALGSLSVTTWLYPVSLIFTNLSFVVTMMIRRRQLAKRKLV